MVLAAAYDFGAERGFGALLKLCVVVLGNIDILLDLIQLSYRNITGAFKAVSNFERMDAFVKKLLGLLEDCTRQNDDTSSAVTDFVVL